MPKFMSLGSPPRVWGKRRDAQRARNSFRFTPTRVGKTRVKPLLGGISPGSPPRVWGKHLTGNGAARALGGSPPRVWGKRPPVTISGRVGRFTPTRVGKTPFLYGRDLLYLPVHPHACGENVDPGLRSAPPPVHPHACGENGRTWRGRTVRCSVHPHACGENVALSLSIWIPVHPHACGENVPLRAASPARIAVHPHACGENVRGGHRRHLRRAVHPHACGENANLRCPPSLPLTGSPPRVWGKRRRPRYSAAPRFTPTRVGKTRRGFMRREQAGSPPRVWGKRASISSPHGPSVHPHACGENLGFERRNRRSSGSPPRVWGKPVLCLA